MEEAGFQVNLHAKVRSPTDLARLSWRSKMSLLDKANCPGEDKLLGYIEGGLSFFGRLRLEKHLANCDDCRELLGLMARMERDWAALFDSLDDRKVKDQVASLRPLVEKDDRTYFKETARARPHTSTPLLVGVSLLIVVVIATVYWITKKRASAETAMEALREAVSAERRIPLRVSGGLPYSPNIEARRAEVDSEYERALARLRSADTAAASTNERLALARVYLARAGEGDAEKALMILEELISSGVAPPEVLNDKGVALSQLGRYDQAIVAFDEALARSPAMGEALFNKAFVEQLVGLIDQARRDWEHFISTSPEDGWKKEAQQYLDQLLSDN
jgi:tetratricopeptide (TPR) repeat protein